MLSCTTSKLSDKELLGKGLHRQLPTIAWYMFSELLRGSPQKDLWVPLDPPCGSLLRVGSRSDQTRVRYFHVKVMGDCSTVGARDLFL